MYFASSSRSEFNLKENDKQIITAIVFINDQTGQDFRDQKRPKFGKK